MIEFESRLRMTWNFYGDRLAFLRQPAVHLVGALGQQIVRSELNMLQLQTSLFDAPNIKQIVDQAGEISAAAQRMLEQIALIDG